MERSYEAIKAESLVKTYRTYERRGFFKKKEKLVEALRGVDLRVSWGKLYGLLGPNGAGKTTTVKILSTLLLPDGGEAWVNGYNVVREPIKVRESIGVVLSVEKGFFWKLTGRENLRYFGMLRGLDGADLEEAIDRAIGLVGLDRLGAEDKLYEEYSLGMKARLSLARALLHDPPILILDEPTLGLDPPAAREIRTLLASLAHREGKAVMITTHNMFEAEMICDYVSIISDGRIAASGSVDELKRLVSGKIPIEVKFTGRPLENKDGLLSKLSSIAHVSESSVKVLEDGYTARLLVESGAAEEVISEAVRMLSSAGFRILRADVQEPTLEDVFITVAGGVR